MSIWSAARVGVIFGMITSIGVPGMLRAQPARAGLAGEWTLEFQTVPPADEPRARPAKWLTFSTTLVEVDSTVGGAMQAPGGPTGQFGCRRRSELGCEAGRMRLSWDEQDWQLFEFRLDPGSSTHGTGRAEIRFPTGATDRYTFTMTRK